MTTSNTGRASFSKSNTALLAIPYSITTGDEKNFDLTVSSPVDTAPDPSYISSQLKSVEWIQRYGLKSQRLTFDQILQQIGFKRLESYTSTIGKTVGAKYAGNLYHEVQHENGERYVLTCRPEKLREYRNRLTRLLNILRKRLNYLNNGSRRIFGVLGEPSICFVCDCKTLDHNNFNQFQTAVISLLKEQVSKIKRFNLIWVSEDTEQFQSQPVDVTPGSVDHGIDWITDRKSARNKISVSATCEAILEAFKQNVHSIYLITEGDSSDSAREMLRDNIVKTRLSSNAPKPIHVVSLFCRNNETETFLRSIAQTADGSYVSYKIHHEVKDFKAQSNTHDPTRIQLQENKIQFGNYATLPASNQPIDISLMYKEILQCENIIERLDKILGFIRDDTTSNALVPAETSKSLDAFDSSKQIHRGENNLQRSLIIQSSALFNNEENDMASIDWLKIYGIDAQKLDFFTVLQAVAFRHCDGVVTLYKAPETINGTREVPPANGMDRLVNAKYCDQFAHVKWPDGTLRHVYISPEFFRDYERKIRAMLEKVRARLLWLKKGSRDVFGTVIEKNIYFLIDTSKSMQNHLTFVKEKLLLLIQEQLRTKERVNMVSFNSTINPWRDRLTRISNSGTQSQLQQWIEQLTANGSTNTLSALRFALADPDTEAMYLLTDGRPDQNERHVLSQVQYRQTIPVHTIAFNCQDATANQFLFDLSKQTGGRFHAFNYGYETRSSIELPESEDISYLKKELTRGEEDLKKISQLRDECLGRAWAKDSLTSTYQSSPTEALSPVLLPLRSRSSANISSELNLGHEDQTMNSRLVPTPSKQVERPKRATTMNIPRKEMSKSVSSSFHEKKATSSSADQFLLRETVEYLENSQKRRRNISLGESIEAQTTGRVTPMATSRRRLNALEEVKVYLKKNNLTARSLTIVDIVHPTTMPIKDPERIQIIDRYVMAKVWDDIAPFLHESYAKKFRSVNHYTIGLEKYETELKNLIDEYSDFTSRLIWKCLDDAAKEKLAPKIYWTVLTDDAKQQLTQEFTREEQVETNTLEMFAWQKLEDREKKEYLTRPARYNDKTARILRQSVIDAEDNSAEDAIIRMDTEIRRAEKFLEVSTDLRRHLKRSQPRPTEKSPTKPVRLVKSAVVRRKFGQRVLCRYDADGYFYPGTIERDSKDRSIVFFDNEIEQTLNGHAVIPYDQGSNQLRLHLHDCVLARLTNEHEEFWIPGLVRCPPTSACVLPAKVHLVEIYNPRPEQLYFHRKDLVRISFTIFQRAIVYLQTIDSKKRRRSVPIADEPAPVPPPPPPPQENLQETLRSLLDPLAEKIDHIDRSNKNRYHQLHDTLEDHMGAIRLLQQHSVPIEVRTEYAQTNRVETPPRTPRISTPTENTERTSVSSKSICTLEVDMHVFAVWLDHDALVYEGKISKVHQNNQFQVERCDYPGVRSVIKRNEIFLDSNQCPLKNLDSESFALILYPDDFRRCRCPAVINRQNKSTTSVRFYDCLTKDLDHNQLAIPLNEQQFEFYSTKRIEWEKSIVGKAIVGFHPDLKVFMTGEIVGRTGFGHQYEILWCDRSQTEQNEELLFGDFSPRPALHVGDLVLALNKDEKLYEPGRVQSVSKQEEKVTVDIFSFSSNSESSSARRIELPWKFTYVITKAHLEKITNLVEDQSNSFLFNSSP